jgi:hypothetical protein
VQVGSCVLLEMGLQQLVALARIAAVAKIDCHQTSAPIGLCDTLEHNDNVAKIVLLGSVTLLCMDLSLRR